MQTNGVCIPGKQTIVEAYEKKNELKSANDKIIPGHSGRWWAGNLAGSKTNKTKCRIDKKSFKIFDFER